MGQEAAGAAQGVDWIGEQPDSGMVSAWRWHNRLGLMIQKVIDRINGFGT